MTKELRNIIDLCIDSRDPLAGIFKREIQQEAIKWIKHIRKIVTTFDSNIFSPKDVVGAEKAIRIFLKITEEDLK